MFVDWLLAWWCLNFRSILWFFFSYKILKRICMKTKKKIMSKTWFSFSVYNNNKKISRESSSLKDTNSIFYNTSLRNKLIESRRRKRKTFFFLLSIIACRHEMENFSISRKFDDFGQFLFFFYETLIWKGISLLPSHTTISELYCIT